MRTIKTAPHTCILQYFLQKIYFFIVFFSAMLVKGNNFEFLLVLQTNRICHWSPMQTERSQPEGKRVMPETRFTEFPALSIDPRFGISQSVLETAVKLFFLPMPLKIIIYHSSFFFIFDILHRIMTFSNIIRCFSWWCKNGVTSEI